MKTNRSVIYQQNSRGKGKGFSLVTVLCSGLIGAMWVTAAYSMLIPLLNQSSGGKQNLMIRTLAESAIDYVSNDIVTGMMTGQASKFDDTETGLPYKEFELDAEQLGIADTSNNHVRLSVTVKNQAPPVLANSAFNDIQTVNSTGQDPKKKWSMVRDNQSAWRVIEIRALSMGSGSTKVVFRAILKPLFASNGLSDSAGGSTQNYFNSNAAFASTNLSIGDNSEISGNISTNGSKSATGSPLGIFGTDIKINGNVNVNSLDVQSEDIVAKGGYTPKDGAAPPEINGFVETNGKVSGITTDGADNSVQVNPPEGDTSGRPVITEGGEAAQSGVAPAPSAPSDAIDLGSINLSGNAKLVFQDGAASVPSGQSLSNLSSGVATIPPGNYKVSSVSVSESASITVGSSSSVSSPVGLYVENSGSGNTAVNIGGQGVLQSAGNSGNFQIWYNGSQSINISSPNSTMAVYAPNAPIVVSGSSSKANFTGALVGNTVSISNAKLTFEIPTANTKNPQNNTSPSMSVYDNGSGKPSLKPHGLKRVLWQELSYGDWISQGNAPF